ncbi:MAG: hypothetical protein HY912_15725 [Desulfomonile tiedjei]|uniref:Uncharacterized protein n=1 Tax=Desulfomonile tiedjei TaxID=2358 RepID=A0A9D6V3Q2_9BACT|nr:hypothetical protein [Desulfomonile tiedjei]
MSSLFKEFSDTYAEFKRQFPKHPLVEELRSRISRGKFPSDEWLRSRTKVMRDLMAPVWGRSQSTESQSPSDYSDVA